MHFIYSEWDDRFNQSGKSPFETLWDLFQELLTISGGDVSQALRWLNQVDEEYEITASTSKRVGIGLYSFYILAIGAIGSIIYAEFSKIFSK